MSCNLAWISKREENEWRAHPRPPLRTHSGPGGRQDGPGGPPTVAAHPRRSFRSCRGCAAVDAIVYKSVGAQIEDGRDQGQEGAPRRGGGPRGRPLHHFLAPDGATYVLYIYFA